MGELLVHIERIRERHQVVVRTATALAQAPLATGAQRATARALADAGAHLGQALAAASRASAMAARLHEVDGLDRPIPENVRGRAALALNMALSRTRLALTEASDGLRLQARTGRSDALPARRRAAVVRSTAAARTASAPAFATPSVITSLPAPAAPRR
ncbi:hypothetical protein [Kitasatospora phosalacinea]|uniref:Uncharacterized protein n=1 Tax=Kitasatospora phosalacinea TaxID=2065 RepID=A0A9W6UT33_9ACTN|nr:hypothetical protein [Kitasatospora phosalacinea]GLW58185.1 hypothetical protein Kpho01_61960 [Kitasatospora phosalacinea]